MPAVAHKHLKPHAAQMRTTHDLEALASLALQIYQRAPFPGECHRFATVLPPFCPFHWWVSVVYCSLVKIFFPSPAGWGIIIERRITKMEKITVLVGTIRAVNARVLDERRQVEFEADVLGHYKTLIGNNDTRGMDQVLYRTEDGRLLAHTKKWSWWQGEPDIYTLYKVIKADLLPGGAFEHLGYECGFEESVSSVI